MIRTLTLSLALLSLVACASPQPKPTPPPPAPKPAPPPEDPNVPHPMHDDEFARLKKTIAMELGDKAKVALLETALGQNWLTVQQAGKLLDVVVYRDGKLDALPIIHARILDRHEEYLLIQRFTYREDKEKAQEILSK